MSDNQTIDGVSRKSLEQSLKLAALFDDGGVVWILRALLDAEPEDYPPCDYCGIVPAYHPWHGSGPLAGAESPHIHACNECRHLLPAPQPKGEPVAYDPAKENKQFEAWARTQSQVDLRLCDIGLYYERQTGLAHDAWQHRAKLADQPESVAVVLPERSNQDYAIEHAEYMAKSADEVLAKFQAYGLALLAVDEGGDDGEDELLENIDSARGDLQESLVGLRSMVYEFRKRSAKT